MESPTPIVRPARVPPTSEVETRLGSEFGRLVNVSATGALVRTRMPFLIGRQCPLMLHAPNTTVTLFVRIVRTQHVAVELPGAISHLQEYLVGVNFLEVPAHAREVVQTLCGESFSRYE
jgi:PilZ domain